METCSKCKLQFPEHLLQTMTVKRRGEGLSHIRACPICCLRITNEIHGTNYTDFRGEIARDLLRQARQFIGEKV